MIKRKQNGQFEKGSQPINGFKKGIKGNKHPNWKGGWKNKLPKCKTCGIQLGSMRAKNCIKHSFSKNRIEKIKNGAKKRIGKKHWAWKGNRASYRGKHYWIVRELGKPEKCDICKKDGLKGHQIHWANISRNYKRIITDWRRLCAKCHKNFDKSRV